MQNQYPHTDARASLAANPPKKYYSLVNLDGAENLSHKPQTNQSTHASSYQEHRCADEEHISKVQHICDEHPRCFQTLEPERTVDEGVPSDATR